MIHAGTDLKYRVTSTLKDFDIAHDDFSIIIKNRWGQTLTTITWEDCLWDSDNNPYFVIENIKAGVFYACFYALTPDDDYRKGTATFVDRQKLVTVDICDCDCHADCCCEEEEHDIHYEHVTTTGGDFLIDCNGQYILTSEGNYIVFGELKQKKTRDMGTTRLNMTGEEFKTLIEGRVDNDKIDTLPEVLDALGRIDDDKELDVMTEDDASDMMAQILGKNNQNR